MNGKVFDGNIPLFNVEIINSTKKYVVESNERGEFQIQTEPNDVIIFS